MEAKILLWGILVLAFGIHRKPAFFNTLLLREEFTDAPQGRERKDTQKNRQIRVAYKETAGNTRQADEQVHPPNLRAEIILRLDYYRVLDTDTKKGCKAKNNSFVVHVK